MDSELILLVTIIIGCIIIIAVLANLAQKISDRFGSAKLEKHRRFYSCKNKGLPINGRNRISRRASMRHVVVLGPTGAGKSVIYFMNALLLASGSKVVTDVKGTLYRLFSGVLKYILGYKILLIDVMNTECSLYHNILLELSDESDAQKWTEAIYGMHNSSERTEGIWRRGAISCISMILICLIRMKMPKYLTITNLIYLVGKLGSQEGCKELEGFIATYGRDGNDASIIRSFEQYRQQETKIMSGQHSEAMAVLAQFDNKQMRQLMSGHDIDFASFRKEKTVLFIKVPSSKADVYAPFLAMFYSQFFDYLLDTEVEPTDEDIYFLLDEFAQLKALPNFSEVVSLIRSKGVSISIALQSMLQLERVYGKVDGEVILDNIGTHVLLPSITNVRTLKHYQDLIGVSTRQEEDENGRESISRRSVLNADEIRRLEDNEMLVIHGNLNATKMRTYPLYKNPRLMAMARLKSKNGRFVPQIEPVQMPIREVGDIPLLNLTEFNHILNRKMASWSHFSVPQSAEVLNNSL